MRESVQGLERVDTLIRLAAEADLMVFNDFAL